MSDIHPLAIRATRLHHDLIKAGLYETGRLMHAVVQKIGYEIAELPEVPRDPLTGHVRNARDLDKEPNTGLKEP